MGERKGQFFLGCLFPGQNVSCIYMLSFLCKHTDSQVCAKELSFSLSLSLLHTLSAFFPPYTGKCWSFNFTEMSESPQNGRWLPGQTVVPASSYVSHLNVTYTSLASRFMVALVLHQTNNKIFKNAILNGIVGGYLCK